LGWALDNVLFYATDGAVWTQFKASASFTDAEIPAFDNDILVGTLGANWRF
jgi:hypothetical protein